LRDQLAIPVRGRDPMAGSSTRWKWLFMHSGRRRRNRDL